MEEKKINFAAVEIVNLLGELDFNQTESLAAVSKVMHFIIEKGFNKTVEATSDFINRTINSIALYNSICKN